MPRLSMREMLEAGVHFGHQTRYWNPKMRPYLFGQRNKIHIINLEKTLPLFNEALNFISRLSAKRGTILFVGTKRAAQGIIKEEALRCEMPYVNRHWLGGLLTNYKTVKQSIVRLKDLEAMQEDGSLARMNKKEVLRHKRELEKLDNNLAGIKDMQVVAPDAMFVVDVGYEDIAVREARKLNIPVVGVVDSNTDPDGVDYVIPGNDDAIRAIRLYAREVADAILQGRESVAHLGLEEGDDEFIELDETGAPVVEKKARKTKKKSQATIRQKASRKRAVKQEVAREEHQGAPAAEVGANEPTAAEPAPVAAEETKTAEDAASVAKPEAEPAIEPVTDSAPAAASEPAPADAEQIAPERTAEKQTAPEQAAEKQIVPEQAAEKQTAPKQTDNKKVTPAAPASIHDSDTISVNKADSPYRVNSARAAWWEFMQRYDGKPVAAFVEDAQQQPPSRPKSGKGEPPVSWIRFFVNDGRVALIPSAGKAANEEGKK